jgi:hypothetical protein
MAIKHTPLPTSPSLVGSELSDSSSSTSTVIQSHINLYAYDFNNNNNGDDDNYIFVDPLPFSFTETKLQAIKDCIHDNTLPTWIQRPPTNLGEPSHGKLKAQKYLTLFTCIFLLIISEF